MFVRHGGVLRDDCPVSDVTPGADDVTVRTTRGDVICRKVCLAAGPWTNQLLKPLDLHLPLRVSEMCVGHEENRNTGLHSFIHYVLLINYSFKEWQCTVYSCIRNRRTPPRDPYLIFDI